MYRADCYSDNTPAIIKTYTEQFYIKTVVVLNDNGNQSVKYTYPPSLPTCPLGLGDLTALPSLSLSLPR